MDLASVVAAVASVGVRVSGSTPNNNIQGDSSRACPTGLAGPEPSGTLNDPGQHFHVLSMGGVAPHTTPVRSRPPSLGAICVLSWRVGAGSLVLRGPCGSRRLGRGGWVALRLLSRAGGGTIPPASGGGGQGPHGLRAGGGGGGGGRAAASLLPFWVGACGTQSWPPSCRRRTLFRRARAVGVAVPPRGGGGVRGGPWTAPPGGAPADLNPPSALPEWAVVTEGSCRARPPYCSGAPPCAAQKLGARVAPARWCGLASQPRPPREQAAEGAGARGVQVQPHPPPPGVAVLSGGGASPRLRGVGGPLLWLQCWGGGSGGGGEAPPPPPPAPSGVDLPSVVSGVPLWGILVPWGLPGGRGRRARSGRPPRGQCGGGGGRGGGPPRPGSRPRLPLAGL